jgi:hypothetical protein
MMEGSFTRKPLSRYINAEKQDYFNARRVVNGVDRAGRIGDAARSLQSYFILTRVSATPSSFIEGVYTITNDTINFSDVF